MHDGRGNLWITVAFFLASLALLWRSTFLRTYNVDKLLDASFRKQTVAADGVQLSAIQLTVLHRTRGSLIRSQGGSPFSFDESWLCRSPGGSFLLAIGQGQTEHQTLIISWSWRTLSEERARQSLLHDAKAYRKVFGEHNLLNRG
jgi:hypothetical protein